MRHAILLISCPDQKGITATITTFIFKYNGNIINADQHIDDQNNTFFMRIEWSLEGFSCPDDRIAEEFSHIVKRFSMEWALFFTKDIPRVAIFVSKPLHCLYDLLYRYKAGYLICDIPLIMSNHMDARNIAHNYNIPFYQFVINPENKLKQEKEEIELLKREKIDLIILARYHQLLSPSFVEVFKNRIINIHHSFLPAFAGRSPYSQAYHKGVKIIGATSHYITAELDEGPIIEQDTVRVSHRDRLQDLVRKGEDLEKIVLGRAVRWHLEHKILCYGNKTVVFD